MGTPYLGPAGIFSTGDPAVDQRQIEAEQFEDPFIQDDDYQEPEDPGMIDVFAWCEIKDVWYDYCSIPGDSYESYQEEARKAHAITCPCGSDANFRVSRGPKAK